MKNTRYKINCLSAAFVLFLTIFIQIPGLASANDLLNRSVTVGSSFVSANTTHTFNFRTQTTSPVGSIRFLYCSNSPLNGDPCTAPVGLNVSGAGILSQSGLTGFAVSGASTNNSLIISRPPAPENPAIASFKLGNVINPSTVGSTVYIRISTYDGVDSTGAEIDNGSVVFVTEDPFAVSLYVPPYMTFCVGVNVALDCSSTAGFLADFGEFSKTRASTATTQFAVATNDLSGYNAFINGQTMTSGSNVIPNLLNQTTSQPGTSQFGINLRLNNNPSVGSDPEFGPVASGSPAPNYNSANQFRFVSGDIIASSPVTTGFNRYTVSYLVNVSTDQKPGVYAATLTYTAIASF